MLVRACLEAHPGLAVAAEAACAAEALARIAETGPDAMVLDIVMPGVDGTDLLRQVMKLRPMPVVMLSGLTPAGSGRAVEALSIGAVDCLQKSKGYLNPATGLLAARVAAAAEARVVGSPQNALEFPPGRRPGPAGPAASPSSAQGTMILLGASTGGVQAIEALLGDWPPDAPPTLIAQHMPEPYLARFAERLASRFERLRVGIGRAGVLPQAGEVWIAPGGSNNLVLAASRGDPVLGLAPRAVEDRYCPSVGRLFASALPWADRTVAVMLSGMGQDGSVEMLRLRQKGAMTIAQDQATSVIHGMPGAAIATGAAQQILPIGRIAAAIQMSIAGRRPG